MKYQKHNLSYQAQAQFKAARLNQRFVSQFFKFQQITHESL